MNYKELGLKTGLEFHQRLDTNKLFCNCSSEITEEYPILIITRKLRPVSGELGELDEAALQEFKRSKTFEYELRKGTSCLVELDEQPPGQVNAEALETALIISLMLDCDVIDDIHFMRKTVIDGSNTSGFQRTAMVAHSGILKTKYGNIPIDNLFLEEESAGIVEETKEKKRYRLDRLGIPLVEIATGIMHLEPKEVKDVALTLGKLLRVTGRVQRGLGTIRQDVNISISKGSRVEIKGLQEIALLDKAIELEVQRQLALLEIKEKLSKVKKQKYTPQDFTKYFEKTENKFIKNDLENSGKVYGLIVPGFSGTLGKELTPGKRFGTELAGHAKAFGLGGIIHSDEDLKKYKLDIAFAKIQKGNDAVIIASGDERKVIGALEDIGKRIEQAFVGVPEETRKFLPDANSLFMRSLAGSKRMYPETDVPNIMITDKDIKELKKNLPDDPEKVLENLKKLDLSDELAETMVTSKRAKLFYSLVDMKVNPTIAASTLENTLTSLRRENIPVENLSDQMITNVFQALNKNKFSKEALPNVLTAWANNPKKALSDILSMEGAETVSKEELLKEIKKIIKEDPTIKEDKRKAFRVVMGSLMEKYRGKADGKLMADLVRKETGA